MSAVPAQDWRIEADEAIRALQAARALLAQPAGDGPMDGDGQIDTNGPLDSNGPMDTVVALEAARTAQAHATNVVRLLTERALRLGASFRLLGYAFDDPYE